MNRYAPAPVRLDRDNVSQLARAFSRAARLRQEGEVFGVPIRHDGGYAGSEPSFCESLGVWEPGDDGLSAETWIDLPYVSDLYDDDGVLVDGQALCDWIAEELQDVYGELSATAENGFLKLSLTHEESDEETWGSAW